MLKFDKERFSEKLLIIVVALLFVLMLFNCGRYINIKINGNSASLSSMPVNDKRVVLRSASSNNIEKNNSLIEPVFMGFKVKNHLFAAAYSKDIRAKLQEYANESIVKLFTGTCENVNFDTEAQKKDYFNNIKNMESYFVMTFYNDMPASVILPSVAKDYQKKDIEMLFSLNKLFIYPDLQRNMMASAVNSVGDVYVLKPLQDTPFNSSQFEAYNDTELLLTFSYLDKYDTTPVFCDSMITNNFTVTVSRDVNYYRQFESQTNKLFDLFKINDNLVKSFTSSDGNVLNYVDGTNEISIDNNGHINYKSYESGVNLMEFLGYHPEDSNSYAFSDKIIAIKNIINSLDAKMLGGDAVLGIVSATFDDKESVLTVNLKYFCDGMILVNNNNADATFDIKDNYLVSANLYTLNCIRTNEYSMLVPQKVYVPVLEKTKNLMSCYATLVETEQKDCYVPQWAYSVSEE